MARTIDGGATWPESRTPPVLGGFIDVVFAD